MKQRARFMALVLVLVMALALAGCGGSSYASETYSETYDYKASDMSVEAPAEMALEETAADYGGISNSAAGGAEEPRSTGAINTEKIIYSADASVETIDFDGTIQGVYDMVERFGGFMESTSLSGTNYYQAARGRTGSRSAHFVIRVPSENFAAMTGSLSTLGNVPRCSTYSENITRTYYDVDSRLTAYKAQEARLLEMLAIAETVEDMLAIQQQLTEVQYEIDSLTSTLSNYDNQVNYSTVRLSVEEVAEYTPEPTVTLTYWEKMSVGFARSLKSVGNFFTGLLLWLVSNLPVLLLIAAIAAGVYALLRLWLRRLPCREERRATRQARKAERLASRQARKAKRSHISEEDQKKE